jgi:uncharacterized protein YrrD
MEENMKLAKETLNQPLVSITDGKMIGEIKDFFFDEDAQQMSAVLVDQKGLLHPKSLVVERQDIQVFGVDVWLVRDSEVVREFSSGEEDTRLNRMQDMLGREVTTEGGTKIGTIGDVWLDPQVNVIGFGLDKVFVKGPLAEKKFIPRAAVIDLGIRSFGIGSQDRPMTVDLSQAEAANLSE